MEKKEMGEVEKGESKIKGLVGGKKYTRNDIEWPVCFPIYLLPFLLFSAFITNVVCIHQKKTLQNYI